MMIKSIPSDDFSISPAFKAKVNLSVNQRWVVKDDGVLDKMYKKITSTSTDNVYDIKYFGGYNDYGYSYDGVEVYGKRRNKIYDINKNGEHFDSKITSSGENKKFLKSILSRILKEEQKKSIE